MITQYFSLKIEAGVLHFHDANFVVSSQIDKSQIGKNVLERLRKLNLTTDLKNLNYLIKDGFLYAEGWAYTNATYPVTELLII